MADFSSVHFEEAYRQQAERVARQKQENEEWNRSQNPTKEEALAHMKSAERDIASYRQEVEDLEDIRLGVAADIASARKAVENAQAKLNTLREAENKVVLKIGAAKRMLGLALREKGEAREALQRAGARTPVTFEEQQREAREAAAQSRAPGNAVVEVVVTPPRTRGEQH